ncbi:putative phosphatidylinositol-4-phosphate 5-kinase core protein [Daldinia childiae]|uniref:putative phosphatidylinositol-4-phosphate 5-kinase core protein n=1 Tax=Daldinia childiae TaxID=326645 RepID=UPI0014485339|nr:putative phosphatidylinositol-4-phosphate 5-kinase core protein [Daldinia childiae]KAF3067269.1 putative phosphatidylinositol-4-phosphate 5-kinase core protein [Daldinia childiae]
MTRRETLISRSIVYAILTAKEDGRPARKPSLLRRALRLFYLYWLSFRLVREDLFKPLRGIWMINEDSYKASFNVRKQIDKKNKGVLIPMGDMGYSGSTFFCTNDGAYLVKSVPRHFEHDFFKNDMLIPYTDHMRVNRSSLLVHITNFLESTHRTIGTLLGLAPSHHIVMENILYGQDQEPQDGPKPKWESWDLKPTSYFFPERDIAGGALASQATKSKLADEFNDKIRLSEAQATEFERQIENDTLLLANCNAVDYSLFLVRISASDAPTIEPEPLIQLEEAGDEPTPSVQPPFTPPNPPSWRTGVVSSDGREIYRASILDFFWAKHTIHAKAMTTLVRGYNLIDDRGPMSITTDSEEYRNRFLDMCKGIVEVQV